MVLKESLQELQVRLAERLQLALDAPASLDWLAVTAGSRNYLLPLRHSGELVPVVQWESVPHVQPWFLGVTNIRGSLFGGVDLAQFIAHALGKVAHEMGDFLRVEASTPSVVTINPAIEGNCALQVSGLKGLRARDTFSASSAAAQDAPPFFGHQFFDASGECWQEIDLHALSRSPQFLNISA